MKRGVRFLIERGLPRIIRPPRFTSFQSPLALSRLRTSHLPLSVTYGREQAICRSNPVDRGVTLREIVH